jgi:hypothetical protein
LSHLETEEEEEEVFLGTLPSVANRKETREARRLDSVTEGGGVSRSGGGRRGGEGASTRRRQTPGEDYDLANTNADVEFEVGEFAGESGDRDDEESKKGTQFTFCTRIY